MVKGRISYLASDHGNRGKRIPKSRERAILAMVAESRTGSLELVNQSDQTLHRLWIQIFGSRSDLAFRQRKEEGKTERGRDRSCLLVDFYERERRRRGEVKAICEPTACKDRAQTVPGTSSESVRIYFFQNSILKLNSNSGESSRDSRLYL